VGKGLVDMITYIAPVNWGPSARRLLSFVLIVFVRETHVVVSSRVASERPRFRRWRDDGT